MITYLIPLPVILPLFGAGIALVFARHPRIQRLVSISTLTVVLAVSTILLVSADRSGTSVVHVGGWPAPLGITLVADRLAGLMLVVSVAVTLLVLLYSLGQGVADDDSAVPVSIFHPTYLVLSAGVSNAFLSGDLFNLYVGFEVLLAASYVLLTLGGTGERIRAGTTYVVVSLVSSLIFLIAIAMIYAATGTVNMAQLAERLPDVPSGTRLVLELMLLVAFAIKAAVFPLSSWLPDSYPTAPAPVTAVFAGLLTKVGVYAIIRTETLLFPGGRLSNLLMWAALFTMIVGILGAVAQNDIKRVLSFTLVSHMGYMIFGIALVSDGGLSGAIFYVAHHITVQTTLFLVAGLIERRAGTTSVRDIGGLAAAAPVLGILFFIPAMNLGGIPPFSGFLGKVGLLQAGIANGSALSWLLVIAGTLTSLLTLWAIAKIWTKAFWQAPTAAVIDGAAGPSDGSGSALPKGMVIPTAALVALGVAITLMAGPLFGLSDRAATDLRHPSSYITSVFDGNSK